MIRVCRRLPHLLQNWRAARIIRQSGRFDSEYYLALYPEVAALGIDPIWHYSTVGHLAMLNPCAAFDTRYYVSTYPDVRGQRINPYAHYISVGERLGRHPKFPLSLDRRHRQVAAEVDLRSSVASVSRRERHVHDVAIALHLFYAELWPEMHGYLTNIDEAFDLYVTLSSDESSDVTRDMIHAAYPRAVIQKTVNRGRDIAPFLHFLNSEGLLAHRFVCKIHSKKSSHIAHGDRWRRSMLEDLLGSRSRFQSIKRTFEGDPRIGICGPSSSWLETDPNARSNAARMAELCRALHIPHVPTPFFGGSMFWFRPKALEALARLALTADEFEPELGQVDGTLAHAIERAFTIVASHAGFDVHRTPDSA